MTDEQRKEFTRRIAAASKSELIVITYELFQAYLDTLKEAYENKEEKAYQASVQKALACVHELSQSLVLQYQVGVLLLQLYDYVGLKLQISMPLQTVDNLQEVKKIMSSLQTAFEEVSKQDQGEPLMSNSQAVYAGLTYSKSSLNETITETKNRGFLA